MSAALTRRTHRLLVATIPDDTTDMLTILADTIDEGPLNRVFATWKMAEDDHVEIHWNAKAPPGRIGALLDEADDHSLSAEDADRSDPEARRRAVVDEKQAMKLTAKAAALVQALTPDDRALLLSVGNQEIREFVIMNTREAKA